jgi:hypothetical protein
MFCPDVRMDRNPPHFSVLQTSIPYFHWDAGFLRNPCISVGLFLLFSFRNDTINLLFIWKGAVFIL